MALEKPMSSENPFLGMDRFYNKEKTSRERFDNLLNLPEHSSSAEESEDEDNDESSTRHS